MPQAHTSIDIVAKDSIVTVADTKVSPDQDIRKNEPESASCADIPPIPVPVCLIFV